MDVWDYDGDGGQHDDKIDNFTFPLSNPLNKFKSSNSLTVQGHHKVGNLTLSYGNMTTDPTPCNSMECPTPDTSTPTDQSKYTHVACRGKLTLLARTFSIKFDVTTKVLIKTTFHFTMYR